MLLLLLLLLCLVFEVTEALLERKEQNSVIDEAVELKERERGLRWDTGLSV